MDKILFPNQVKYLQSFRKKDDALLNELEEYAIKNKVPILTWDSAAFIEQLICIVKPKRVLEIGTAIAYTTIRIARNLKKKSIVHTIEKSKDNLIIARNNIAQSGLEEKIKIYEGDAFDILPALSKKYDFIFLDADKEDYKKLFEYSLVLLKKGGIIFVDNLLWHGYTAAAQIPPNYKNSTAFIREFNEEFMSHPDLFSTIIAVGDGIGLGIKKKK